ncbi:alginate lyase family protein [Gammaproteobacteria bacterium AH-315-C21]|nr:alginate lyase family protein [Gammaproteobacteria bacterium AH-315-C21]
MLWKKHYDIDERHLSELVAGSLTLFGHHKVQLREPLNWHVDPVSGVCAPMDYGKSINYRDADLVGNIKVVWELGRHHHLVPMAVAYALTGEERYLKPITDQIETWVEQNPFAIGVHWCSALELALRLIGWALVHSLIASRNGGEGLFKVVNDPKALGDSIYQQAWFIRHYLSRHSSAGNHLFGELAGLWVACQVFDLGADGKRWAAESQKELEEQLQCQVFGDGVGKEQALYYHLWVLDYALFLKVVGRRVNSPFSEKFNARLEAMANFIRDVTPPGGHPPQLGDADDGFVTRFSAIWPTDPYKDVLDAERLIREKCVAEQLSEKAFWYGIIAGEHETLGKSQSCLAEEKSYPRIYSEGGYTVLGNEDCHLVFDTGSLGYLSIAAHGHADALSFVLAIDGEWWLVDPGTYVYHQSPEWRDHFRSTRAHNCLVVDGRDQSEICGPFMWSNHANATLIEYGGSIATEQWVKACHDGYQNMGVTHTREIRLKTDSGSVNVLDHLEGENNHFVEIWFQCAPGVQLVPQSGGSNTWVMTKSGDSRVVYLQLDPGMSWEALRGQESPYIAGWYSSKLDHREPSCALRGCANLALPISIANSIHYSKDFADNSLREI